ncbi:Putative clathrin assembly protein [Galdieria sulphuraria]|uniref:ANTH domain-containing protein n=1 Tax=Galdieria sulphuraria TaxID=130081 RepID=M2X6A2_GALSU|nr:ANTH domain-containing protein [Galdieria sulphuraria]EME32045.1 ANTH domain-containing protein [Galdieria sulphuraria]GJD09912.1 Putative clathrin assembly protein [Galdieria sulphuraria]|eukprot:XP_005708565.1 ANTH domain-containing protein [Galdieria sulphuraria]
MENLKLQDNVSYMGGMQKQRLFADIGVKRKSFDHLDRRESEWLDSKLDTIGPRRSQLPFCNVPLGDKVEPSSTIGYHLSTTRGRASSFHGYISDAYQQAVASAKRDHWKILVIKATSHERIPPKEKHVFQLVQGSHWGGSIENREAPCGSIYRQLGKRLLSEEWIVVLKSLVVFHRIFREGSDSFASEVSRSSSAIFNLQGFRDSSHGGWNHVPFIRCYGRYLESWCRTKANIHFPEGPVYTDIPQVEWTDANAFENHNERPSHAIHEHMKKTKFLYGPHRYRECSIEQLLEELPWLLENLECLVSCEIQGNMKRCPIALAGFSLILSDSYRLWNVICDAMENLVESYFFLPYEQAREALTVYGHFLKLLRKLRKFFESARMINAQVSVPEINRIPSNIAGEMERYLRKAFLGKNSHSTCVSRGCSSRKKVLDSYPGMDLAPIPIPEAQFGPTSVHSSSGISKRRTSTVQHMIGSEAEANNRHYSASIQETHPKHNNYYYYGDTSTPASYVERGKAHRRSVSGSFYSNGRLSNISQTQLPSSYIPPSAPSERSSSTSQRSGYGISSMRYPNRFLHRQEYPHVVNSPSESSSSRLKKSTRSLFTPKPSWSVYAGPHEEGWIYNPRKYYYYGEDLNLHDNRGYTVSSSPQMAERHYRRAYSLPSAQ